MTLPGADIMEFSQGGIRRVDYRETEHYQITKRFLDDPERMLKYLLE
jgi:predicted ATPase